MFFPILLFFYRNVSLDTSERWKTVLGWSRAEIRPSAWIHGGYSAPHEERLPRRPTLTATRPPAERLREPHKVSVYGRAEALRRYAVTLARDEELRANVRSLAGCLSLHSGARVP